MDLHDKDYNYQDLNDGNFPSIIKAASCAYRAEIKLGADGYGTGEHSAICCKTGITESHELEVLAEFPKWWDKLLNRKFHKKAGKLRRAA